MKDLNALPIEARRRIFCALVHIARQPGGGAEASERAVLSRYADRLGLSEEAAKLEEEVSSGEPPPLGEGDAEREALLEGLIDVVTADGQLDEHERERFTKILASLGIEL